MKAIACIAIAVGALLAANASLAWFRNVIYLQSSANALAEQSVRVYQQQLAANARTERYIEQILAANGGQQTPELKRMEKEVDNPPSPPPATPGPCFREDAACGVAPNVDPIAREGVQSLVALIFLLPGAALLLRRRPA